MYIIHKTISKKNKYGSQHATALNANLSRHPSAIHKSTQIKVSEKKTVQRKRKKKQNEKKTETK